MTNLKARDGCEIQRQVTLVKAISRIAKPRDGVKSSGENQKQVKCITGKEVYVKISGTDSESTLT